MTRAHNEHGDKGYIEDQRAFFDKLITQDWDTYINSRWDETRQFEVNEILRLIPACKSVLDVGCGCGYHDVLFAQAPTIERIVGIDYSSNSIEQANKHYPHPKIERHVADIFEYQQLIRRFGQFDLVTSFQVFEHLTEPENFLKACANCTVDGGYVAVVTPNRNSLQNQMLKLLGREPVLTDPLHFAEYTLQELIEIGTTSGLRFIDGFGRTMSFSLKGLTIFNGTTRLDMHMGRLMPRIANIHGVVYQKSK